MKRKLYSTSAAAVRNNEDLHRLRAENAELRAALTIIANHLEKAPKFAAIEYSDDLLIPYTDIEKFARAALNSIATGEAHD